MELDATWAEDIVYPDTNDYHNYTNNNGPNVLGQPWTRLDDGGTGSYEDCLWEHYLSGVHTEAIILEVDNQLPLVGGDIKAAYNNALMTFGSSWLDAYPGFLEWAWFTGSRSEPGFGFPDALQLKRMNLHVGGITTYPYSQSATVDQLAGRPYRFNGSNATFPRVIFDGDDTHENFTVSMIVKELGGAFTIYRPALDANNDLDWTAPVTFADQSYLGVIVTNSKRRLGAVPYTITVEESAGATGVPTLAGGIDQLAMEPARPNPFAAGTRIAFTTPSEGHVMARVLDVRGRLVRTLLDATRPAGSSELLWDGRDEAGRLLANGIYWMRVETEYGSVARKVTLLR